MSEQERRRIHGVRVQNVLAVEAVDLRPAEAGITLIAGRNGSGKSSLLRAVELLLEWRAAAQKVADPVLRRGAEKGWVELDLGDVVARRTFTESGTTLVVERKETRDVVRAPQTFLDALRPPTLLDPLNFSTMSPAERRRVLIEAAGLGGMLRQMDLELNNAEELRRETGRALRATKVLLDSAPPAPEGAPAEPVSAAELLSEIGKAEEKRRQAVDADRALIDLNRHASTCRQRIQALEAQLAAEHTTMNGIVAQAATLERNLAEALAAAPTEEQVLALRERVAQVDELNKAHELRRNRELAEQNYAEAVEAQSVQDSAVAEMRAARDRLVGEAPLPLEGLGFDEEDATYRGTRWASLGTAEQLRVGLSLGLAQHPGLPVFVMHRAESLDAESLRAVDDWARENGVQVLAEVVGGEGRAGAYVLEAGRLRGEELDPPFVPYDPTVKEESS